MPRGTLHSDMLNHNEVHMDARDQEAMFGLMKVQFGWDDGFTSGYVHGAVDAGGGLADADCTKASRKDMYARGYRLGFAVHFGEDVEQQSWFGILGRNK